MNRVVNRIMRNDLNAIDSHGARGTSCNFAQMVLKATSQQTFGFAPIYVDYTIILIVRLHVISLVSCQRHLIKAQKCPPKIYFKQD